MNKKNKKNFPVIKKDIKSFLTSEEGNINKKNMVKIAMSVIALGMGLSGMMKTDDADAACTHASHANHSNHSNHSSY